MTRGLFDVIANTTAYRGAEKYWHITLDRSEFFWYELVVDPPQFAASKQAIVAYLDALRDAVKETLEKRFIYFYLSRTKVRFNTKKQPSYSWFGGKLKVHLLIGRDQIPRSISVQMPKRKDGRYLCPDVEVDERFIYFHDPTFSSAAPIHDFLRNNHISLGLHSEVQYVGITKDPGSRTINREHRGYADTLYFCPTDDNDIFLCVNLFKVMADASSDYGIRFVVPNSMTNEIPTDEEGEVIELALINYFDTKPQEPDKDRSWARFRNVLSELQATNKINSVSVHMELVTPSEYDVISSRRILGDSAHSFLWHLVDSEPTLVQFESEDKIAEFRDHVQDA